MFGCSDRWTSKSEGLSLASGGGQGTGIRSRAWRCASLEGHLRLPGCRRRATPTPTPTRPYRNAPPLGLPPPAPHTSSLQSTAGRRLPICQTYGSLEALGTRVHTESPLQRLQAPCFVLITMNPSIASRPLTRQIRLGLTDGFNARAVPRYASAGPSQVFLGHAIGARTIATTSGSAEKSEAAGAGPHITLYTGTDCSLCDVVKDVLHQVQKDVSDPQWST